MTKEKVTFRLRPEVLQDATMALLLGDFNKWNPEEGIFLQRQEDGSFAAEVELGAGQYQYRYYLNDGRWVDDDNQKVTSEYLGHHVNNCVIIIEEKIEAVHIEEPVAKKEKTEKALKKAEKKPSAKLFEKQFHDLTKIKGINKQVEKVLYNADIRTYGALSKASVKKLAQLMKDAGDKFAKINPETWPKEAKLASTGKWEELELLQLQPKKKK